MQILARLRRDFTDRLAIDRSFEIKHRKIAHLQSARRHVYKISRLLAQTLERLFNFCIRDLRIRQFNGDIFVIRQFKFRCGDYGCAEAHRLVFAELNVFDVRQRRDAQLLLCDCIVVTLGYEFLRQFILDLFAKSFVDHGARRLSRPVPWNLGKPREAVCNCIPLLAHFFRRQFNLQLRDEAGLLFHFNLH